MIERINFNDRATRLAEIKREIAAGLYDTDWRLSQAVDALWEKLSSEAADEDPDQPQRPRQPR